MTRTDIITPAMLKVFETLPDLYLILSPELHILTASNAYLAATFTKREEITGKYIFDVFPEKTTIPGVHSIGNLYASLQEALTTRQPHQMAMQRYDLSQSLDEVSQVEKYWQILNTPVLDDSGHNILYIIHKVNNVTTLVLNQRQVEASSIREQAALDEANLQRKKLQDLFMQAPALIASVKGLTCIFDLVNPPFQELFPGRSLLGQPFIEAIPEMKGQFIMDVFERVYQTGETYNGLEIPIRLHSRDQGAWETRYFTMNCQATRDVAGNILGAILFAYDVTENVRMRNALEQLNQKLEDQVASRTQELKIAQDATEIERSKLYHLLMQAPALICIFEGPEHIFRLANPSYQQLVGDRPILGRSIAQAMPELAGQPIFGLLDKVYQTGESYYAYEMLVQLDHTNSGTLGENYYNFVYQPTRNLEGQIDGILVFAYEVTQQVLARKQVEKNEEHLQQLNAALAASNEELSATNEELSTIKVTLEQLNGELERRVTERTQELRLAQKEIEHQKDRLERFFMQAPVAICVLNGPTMVFELVNSYYQRFFQGRNLLGKPLIEALPELKGQSIQTILEKVYRTGETFEGREVLVPSIRYEGGPVEDSYFTFIYQARHNEKGQADGILVIAYEVTEQVLARRKVEESEKQLRLITDALPVLIGYLDKEEKYRFANRAYESWFNQDPDFLLGRAVREVVGEKAYLGVKKYIDRALSGERLDFEARMPYRENFVKHIRTSYVPDIQNGEVAGFYTLVTDVTEQVEARQKVEESELRFRTLLESIPQITWTALPTGEINFYNERWYDYSGSNYEATKEWGWKLFIHQDDLAATLKTYQQSLSTGEAFKSEFRLRRKQDGEYRWHLSRALPIRNEQDTITLWVGTATDIHEQKIIEQQLMESEQYFHMMADKAPVMIWITRPDGYCTYLNKPWFDYTGQTEDEATGLGWTLATHPEDAEKASNVFMEANENRTEFRLSYRLRRKDGTYRWFTDVGLPRFSHTGEFEGYVGAVLDIHEQKMAEDALQMSTRQLAAINEDLAAANQEIQASNHELSISNQQLIYMNADLDNFIYTASHDLKSPIVNIEGLMKFLMRQLPKEILEGERTNKTISYIQESIERFKHTIANLTEVVKLQKENSQPMTWVDLDKLLHEVKLDLTTEIKKSKARIVVDVSQCPHIQFSEKNLRSTLYNLLSNAIKYRSPERRPEIYIHCGQNEEYQILTIQDNGLGMNLTGDQKLFSMFRRLHTHVEGSGIGLYMVKRMIENSGGKIEVESKVDVGSTFKVYFKRPHQPKP
ncbi:PAS domain-containing protein [Rhodocytophaga rosea]|uniref:histidine kinase n=1 Tax=Rhodocytophaga rosea TaxID=2704465 RepID=A0A6C0GLI6_9BACT|nr:PAS domain-containing protein [Rhodocytophaga rosea]QHT68906.1 PAS domain-containing protein [Rhodocytophaga rosea]